MNDLNDPSVITFQLFYKTDFYLEHVGSVFKEKLYIKNKNKSVLLEFSDKTVILYKLCYTPYISCSVPFPEEYGIKCTENVLFDVIQVTFILIGLLYYWSLSSYVSTCFLLAGADVCFQMLVTFQNFSMNIVVECRELYSHTILKCVSCWQRF